MKAIMILLALLFCNTVFSQTQAKTTVRDSTSVLMNQQEKLYNAADKITDKLIGMPGDFKSKFLLRVSYDSAGYRKSFVTYADSLSFVFCKGIKININWKPDNK
jgi:hypothetical protein